MASVVLLFVLFFAIEAETACSSSELIASTEVKTAGLVYYSNNDYCTISISPGYANGYYLEIKWIDFEIEGNLPECKDYIEVLLTRFKRSIGKYCSGYIGSNKLFNMYSADGYATIRFKSDGSITKKGFKFSYQLKSIRSNYLQKYGNGLCYYSYDPPNPGNFYTSGWPRGYTNGTGFCYFTISVPNGKEVRIPVMDLDLRNAKSICNGGNDHFQIRGSNTFYKDLASILLFAQMLTKTYCGTFNPGFFTFKYSYVYLVINKPFGSYPNYTNRGSMMGYILYDVTQTTTPVTHTTKTAKPDNNDKKNSTSSSINWGLTGGSIGGALVVLATIIGAIKKCTNREEPCCTEFCTNIICCSNNN